MDERRFNWDPGKSERNALQRDLPFEMSRFFEFDTALIYEDDRFVYGEDRFVAIGFIGPRIHVLVFTVRAEITWVISLRKANDREAKRYDRFVESKIRGFRPGAGSDH